MNKVNLYALDIIQSAIDGADNGKLLVQEDFAFEGLEYFVDCECEIAVEYKMNGTDGSWQVVKNESRCNHVIVGYLDDENKVIDITEISENAVDNLLCSIR